jgi:hypothetical protein
MFAFLLVMRCIIELNLLSLFTMLGMQGWPERTQEIPDNGLCYLNRVKRSCKPLIQEQLSGDWEAE